MWKQCFLNDFLLSMLSKKCCKIICMSNPTHVKNDDWECGTTSTVLELQQGIILEISLKLPSFLF